MLDPYNPRSVAFQVIALNEHIAALPSLREHGLIERPQLPRLATRRDATPARKSARAVYFDGALRDTPIYDRAVLPPGFRLEGPAVIEEFGSTTVVFPRQLLYVDPHGILIVRSAGKDVAG